MIDTPSYPGRGILCGTTGDNIPFGAYLLTARSVSSRNRLLVVEDGMIQTTVRDPSLVIDPRLLIYTAMQRVGTTLIIANGDHGELAKAGLGNGVSLPQALAPSCYEPDEPHYTPRITAVADEHGYSLSILRRRDRECERAYWEYGWQTGGHAHLIHTYRGDGEVLPSYSGDPRAIAVGCTAEELPAWIHTSLDERYRLASAVWLLDGSGRIAITNGTDGEAQWTRLN